ncbi:MAG: 50S ribosomal protein L11 methyltransferase [Acidobacteriota bacterium]
MPVHDPPHWYSLAITAEPAAADAIEHALNELDALGTEINYMLRRTDDSVTVAGYFNALPDDEIVQDELHHALRIFDLDEKAIRFVERREVSDQDWLAEWKKHWKPTVIGRFVIAPPWEKLEDDGRIVVQIEPNMAFGTGTHETTRLCLRAIDEKYAVGDSFLDVGTGTGILAIAAAKLAGDPPRFLACDTDGDAIAIAKENAELNGVGQLIEFRIGAISDDTPVFDFVCANLTVDVIVPILPMLLKRAKMTLVLSGILTEQENAIVSALTENNVTNFVINRAGEWIAVVVDS